MSALVTPIKSDLHLTDEQVGRIEAVFHISYVVAVPIFGYFADLGFSRKKLLLFGLLVWSIASIGSGAAYVLTSLLIWRAFVGLGEGTFQSVSPTWLADSFAPRVRNIAFSVFNSTGKIGATIGVAVGAYLATKYSWHVAFMAAGLPGLFLAVGLFKAREPARGAADGWAHTVTKPTWLQTAAIFRNPDYLLHLSGYTFYMMGIGSMFLWGPAFFHRYHQVGNMAAAGFFGLGYTVTGLPGAYIGGFLAAYWYRRTSAAYAFTMGLAMLLVTPVLLGAFSASDASTFKLWIWTEIFLFGICSASATTLVFEVVSISQRGIAFALSLVVSSGIGGMLSTQLLGYLSDQHGLKTAILLAPLGTLLSGISWGWLGLRQKKAERLSRSVAI